MWGMNPLAWWRRDGVIKRRGVVGNMCVSQMETRRNRLRVMVPGWRSVCQLSGALKPVLNLCFPSSLCSLDCRDSWVGVTDAVGRVLLTALSIFMKGHNSSGWKKGNLGLRFKTFLPGQWGLASFIILFIAAVSFPLLSPKKPRFSASGFVPPFLALPHPELRLVTSCSSTCPLDFIWTSLLSGLFLFNLLSEARS